MVLFGDDDEGFKSIHILFTSFIFVICYFVWKSTQVRIIPNSIGAIPIANFGKNNSISETSGCETDLHFP